MENEIIAKENGFFYKGNFYDKGELLITDTYYLVDTETNEEYNLYSLNYKDIPEGRTYKMVKKYSVRKSLCNAVEIFDTEDEAKEFIIAATEKIK